MWSVPRRLLLARCRLRGRSASHCLAPNASRTGITALFDERACEILEREAERVGDSPNRRLVDALGRVLDRAQRVIGDAGSDGELELRQAKTPTKILDVRADMLPACGCEGWHERILLPFVAPPLRTTSRIFLSCPGRLPATPLLHDAFVPGLDEFLDPPCLARAGSEVLV